LKVGEHPNRAPGGFRRLADAAQVSFMIGIVAMTHVESGDVHSCGNQLRQALGARGSRSERAHNLGFTHELTLAKLPEQWESNQAVVYQVPIRSNACRRSAG